MLALKMAVQMELLKVELKVVVLGNSLVARLVETSEHHWAEM